MCVHGWKNYWESVEHRKVGGGDISAKFETDLMTLVAKLDALLPDVHKHYATDSYLRRSPKVRRLKHGVGCFTTLMRVAENIVR